MDGTVSPTSRPSVEEEHELKQCRAIYKSAVEEWIDSIRREEALAGPDCSDHGVEVWEQAHFKEEAARNKAKQARQEYQDILRRINFHF